MEDFEYMNKLEGGFRHLRIQNADEVAKYSVPVETVARPNHNQTGKEIEVLMNAYPITKFPTRNVYQYDVSISCNRTNKAIIGAAPC
jgi:eukaryotic translation initiation factor 2C